MKQKKYILNFIIFTFLNFSLLANIKELPLLDEYNKTFIEEKKMEITNNNKSKKVKKDINFIKNSESKVDSSILNKKVNDILLKDIVDIYEKRTDGKIVYRGNNEEPFTGIFGYVSLDKVKFYENYKNGLLDGETVWFSDNGIKMISEFYKKGKLDGEQKTYYENGNLKSIVIYSNNRVDGVINYDKKGNIIFKDIYKNGTGKWKFYWTNGKLFEEGSYNNYKKHGTWKRYREDGTVNTIKEYNNGRLVKESWK